MAIYTNRLVGRGRIPQTLRSDPIFVGALFLFAFFLIFQAAANYFTEAFIERYSFNRPIANENLASAGSPIEIGAIGKPRGSVAIQISLDFHASNKSGYPNLLQTDMGNRGLRLELSRQFLVLIVGGPTDDSPYRVFVLPKKIGTGEWHNVQLTLLRGHYVGIVLDGVRVDLPQIAIPFSLGDVRIGIGYDNERRFHGDLKNINVSYGNAQALGYFLSITITILPWLLCFLLIAVVQRWLAFYPPTPSDLQRSGALKDQVRAAFLSLHNQTIYLSTLLILSGVFYAIAIHHFQHQYDKINEAVLPGFHMSEGARHFKSELIIFILFEICFTGTVALAWASTCLGVLQTNIKYRNCIIAACFAISAVLVAALGNSVSRIIVLLACVLLVLQAFLVARAWDFVPTPFVANTIAILRRIVRFLRLTLATITDGLNRVLRPLATRNSTHALFLLRSTLLATGMTLCGVMAWPVFQAWYPITITNDYFEARDSVLIRSPSGPVSVGRDELAECLRIASRGEADGPPKPSDPTARTRCDTEIKLTEDERSHLQHVVQATSGWQGEAGRTLYHHSYILMPARHFLEFGFDRAVPYLYGYGNTLFHAALMWTAGGASLSSYFSTFPAAEMVGMIAIGLLVLLITHNGWVAFTGFALSLIAFYLITYVPILLAASFSPLRLLGLVMQLASISICCRGTRPLRFLLLPLAGAVSLFWNGEFALFGLVGQGLLLLSPQMNLTLPRRGVLLASLVAVAAIFAVISRTSPDIVNTVQLLFFNIGMPFMTKHDVVWFFMILTAAHVILLGLSLLFSGSERAMRVACIPVLALLLVKIVFNPAAPHFYLVCTLLLPMCLIYLPWPFSVRTTPQGWTMPWPSAPLLATLMFYCAIQGGLAYKEQARDFRSIYINDFEINKWSDLRETINFITPEKPVSERVMGIRKYINPDDSLVLLSPYDQVLTFYVNPRSICGHFDLLSNLATRDIAEKVFECATRSLQVLLVYDRAAETPCPTDILEVETRCARKAAMKSNLVELREQLLPFMTKVGSDQNLEFYRPTGRLLTHTE